MSRFVPWAGLNCLVTVGKYHNGRIALSLIHEDEQVARITVNLPDEPLAEDEIFVKDYSENQGMLDTLTLAGLVEDTGRRVSSGFVMIPVARLKELP